jgi:hypothetical protein
LKSVRPKSIKQQPKQTQKLTCSFSSPICKTETETSGFLCKNYQTTFWVSQILEGTKLCENRYPKAHAKYISIFMLIHSMSGWTFITRYLLRLFKFFSVRDWVYWVLFVEHVKLLCIIRHLKCFWWRWSWRMRTANTVVGMFHEALCLFWGVRW